ncbi:hypothetical protein [Marisediminicola senii]|uniref:hypothetical protein n=1 Tax=Marisediminicola senii TaxID=2711233 RepID=UPI0013EA8903|nr:hypothetical protein [Marisediminicola senii]
MVAGTARHPILGAVLVIAAVLMSGCSSSGGKFGADPDAADATSPQPPAPLPETPPATLRSASVTTLDVPAVGAKLGKCPAPWVYPQQFVNVEASSHALLSRVMYCASADRQQTTLTNNGRLVNS